MGSVSLCRDEVNSSPHLPCQADPLSGSDGCCLAPHLSAGGITHRSGVTRDPATLDPPVSSSPRSVTLVVTPGLVATGARGPFGPRHRWGLWIDGRWPYPKLRFLEGAAPWDPPFAGVVHGVWTLHPRATCRSLPAPSRAPGRINCVRTGAEEFSGGNWMVSASPRYAGGAAATGRLVRPFHLTTFYPLGGLGSRDSPAARWVGPRDVLP
ncbi:hypothetical protein N7449_012587 [Penicillium cf. viridicatum]|uniref:Uncharacterized protein n=1 Tax=Penicillium cf. viridicatum TaxID=2972119 RepID=A0A9W9ISJ7_9EURO|nr:hypothetical protein N7449_012587 [Penicillium cf. viridicatum]